MNDIVIPITREVPRVGEFANETGSYEQIFRVITPVIDPGDAVLIEQYFSGYGVIKNAKLLSYPSGDIFDKDKSKSYHSIGANKDNAVTFGIAESGFGEDGMYFDLSSSSGIKIAKWDERTYFFDADNQNSKVSLISTERKIGGFPPFKHELYTQKKIKAGTYYIDFCFTYFDGSSWRTNSKSVEFKVRNFLERHDQRIGVTAAIASIIAIIEFGVLPLIELIKSFF